MQIKLKKLVLLSVGVILLASTGYAQSTNKLHFPLAGFSIAALDETPGNAPQQALAMFLRPTEGFAPNVNVQLQPYAGSIDDYLALTLEQFKTANINLVQKKVVGKTIAVFEYNGEIRGQALHWYARAEKSGSHVYLVTGTATQQQWSKLATRLKNCVDSFRCDAGQPGTAPAAQSQR